MELSVLWHLSDRDVVRYNEIRRIVKGLTSFILTKCLRELEEDSLIRRIQYEKVPPRMEDSLTDNGKLFLPSLKSLYM